MNDQSTPLDDNDPLPDALRWQLRAQRRDMPPPVDLWRGIESRLDRAPARTRLRANRFALAASVLLAVVAGGVLLQSRVASTQSDIAHHEAQVLTREYDRALDAMPDPAPAAELAPAFAELDRSARDIRRALQRDPDSRLLLDQLRRTYTLRLALSQRAVVG